MKPNRTFAMDFLAVVAKFSGESDRGAVLVCSSYLEDLLKQLLRKNLKEGKGLKDLFEGKNGLCCTTQFRDSCCESSMVAGCHEQLGTDEIQDQELVAL
ncbi:MAG: hypothetical protein HRU33_23915 [Rhodobacteraceae bacterium]|nr:hypothetical protein [Paracoccaceae bacterium]